MHAMILRRPGAPLEWAELPEPEPGAGEIKVKVLGLRRLPHRSACGGWGIAARPLPIIPGHEIVGQIEALGPDVSGLVLGQRVGIPWLGHTCGVCFYCRSGRENLCDRPLFTGYTRNGGYATAAVADARYAFPLDETGDPVAQAPLLCAGLIGWRSLVMAGEGKSIGLYGFGAAAHIILQVAKWQGRKVFAFTQKGDTKPRILPGNWARIGRAVRTWRRRNFSMPRSSMLRWAPLVPTALKAVRKGGRVVCAGIHMSEIPAFSYDLLWEERQLVSVANLTRQDGLDFLAFASRAGSRRKPRFTNCPTPIARLAICGRAVSTALPCWCPEGLS